jgi:hypothetical protein
VDGFNRRRRQARPGAEPVEDLARTFGEREDPVVVANRGALARLEDFTVDTVDLQGQCEGHAGGTATDNGNLTVAIVGGGATN